MLIAACLLLTKATLNVIVQLPKLGTDLEVQLVPECQHHVPLLSAVLLMVHHGFVAATLSWNLGLFSVMYVLVGVKIAVCGFIQ